MWTKGWFSPIRIDLIDLNNYHPLQMLTQWESISLRIDSLQTFLGDPSSLSVFFCKESTHFVIHSSFVNKHYKAFAFFQALFFCRWELQVPPWPHLSRYSSGNFMYSYDVWWKASYTELGPSYSYSDSLESLDKCFKCYSIKLSCHCLKYRYINVFCVPIAY